MKKELIISITVLFLITSLVLAQTTAPSTTAGAAPSISGPAANSTSIPTGISAIKTKTDSLVDKEIQIPDSLQFLTKIILGVKGPIKFSLLMILIIIWLMAFKLIGELMKFMPFLEKGVMVWIIALLVMLVIGISGGLNYSAKFILGFGNIFKIFKNWSTGQFIFGAIIVLIVALVASKLLKKTKKKIEEEKEKTRADRTGVKIGIWERFWNSMGFGGKIAGEP